MIDISFTERFKTIFKLIFSSSFFISLFVIFIFTIGILLVNFKIKSKAPKYFAVLAYITIMILVLYNYSSYILSINDSVVEKFFKAIYFPNFVVYIAMLFITILLLIINIIDDKFSKVTKICNTFCFGIIWFLFILIIDVVRSSRVNIYEIEEVFSNQSLVVLLQASMCVFCIWIFILIMNFVVRKISGKLDKKDKERGIIRGIRKNNDDEIREYTDEEFQQGYLNQIPNDFNNNQNNNFYNAPNNNGFNNNLGNNNFYNPNSKNDDFYDDEINL